MNIQYFLAPKPSTRNHISRSENALRLTYINVEFQNFPGEGPWTPHFNGWGVGIYRVERRVGEGKGNVGGCGGRKKRWEGKS